MTCPYPSRSAENWADFLVKMAKTLGVGTQVRFMNRYLDLSEIMGSLQACDVYVTPLSRQGPDREWYVGVCHGGRGPVVGTPYLYAEEVLAEGRGQLVPFAQSGPLANVTLRYLMDATFRIETQRLAREYAKAMYWPNMGHLCPDLFRRIASTADQGRTGRAADSSQYLA